MPCTALEEKLKHRALRGKFAVAIVDAADVEWLRVPPVGGVWSLALGLVPMYGTFAAISL